MLFIPEFFFFLCSFAIFFFYILKHLSSKLNFLESENSIYIAYLYIIVQTIYLLYIEPSNASNISSTYFYKTDLTSVFSIFCILFFFFIVILTPRYFYFLKLSYGVYFFIMSICTFCLMCLSHSVNLFLSFVILESISICLYVLCAFNKKDINSVESALKYFIVGTFSSIFILLGIVLLYSLLNTFNMYDIYFFIELEHLSIINNLNLLIIAISFFMLGLLVKVYAAPFQFWIADVYEGAPLTSSFFFSTSYILSISIFFFNCCITFNHVSSWFSFVIQFLGFLTIIVGSVYTLFQYQIRKWLAYSTITTVGYLLLGISTFDVYIIAESFSFFFIYLLNSALIFTLLLSTYVNDAQTLHKLSDLSLIHKTNPFLSYIYSISFFIASGIPPFLYFFLKASLFTSITDNLNIPFLLIIVLGTLFGYFYYLRASKNLHHSDLSICDSNVGISKLEFSNSLLIIFLFTALILMVIQIDLLIDIFLLFLDHYF